MSRFSMCPASYAMGQCGCGSIGVEDATRVVRMLYTPVRIAIVTALIALAMLLALQFAGPLAKLAAPSSGNLFAMYGSSGRASEQDVDRQATQFLADLEERYGSGDDAEVGPRP